MVSENIKRQNIELYNIVHKESVEEELLASKRHILSLLKKNSFPFDKTIAILDAGCGGRFAGLVYYSELHPRRFIGCDINPIFVETTLSHAKNLGLNYEAYECSVEELPLEDESVDFVHCDGVLMNIPDYEKALEELRRVLRIGGYLLLGVYAYGGILKYCGYPLARIIRKTVPIHSMARLVQFMGFLKRPNTSFLDLIYQPVETLFTKEEINTLLISKGFREIDINKSYRKCFNIPVISSILFGFGYMYIIARKGQK